MAFKVCLLALFLFAVEAADEGESCVKDGASATCLNIRNCPVALADLKRRKNPQICGFSGVDPIVCCVRDAPVTSNPQPVATTASPSPTTATEEYVPPVYDYHSNDQSSGGCEKISPSLTSEKTGQKAWDKCIEYQEQLVYPCEKGVALTGDLTRVDHCGHNANELIIGGVDAGKREFPHMVLLGYGDTASSAVWLCAGSLISDRYILTAGHCTSSRESGNITFAIIGALKRTDQVDSSKLYRIRRIIKHPDYKPPGKYNDIALLETETPMKLDESAVPACLDVGEDPSQYARASATGWGATEYRGSNADNLQKVVLTKFTREECALKFSPNKKMLQGFNEQTQMCYGDKNMSKDTCQGDSGGPLQIKNKRIHCMYTVIGVTSFGKACGWIGEPGIYTRVRAFVPWIESIVWP